MPTQIRRSLAAMAVLLLAVFASPGGLARAQEPDGARVRILHASPDAPPMDVFLDGAAIAQGVPYGTISSSLEVAAGEHHLQLVPAGADPSGVVALVDATLPLDAGTSITLAATGALDALEAKVVVDATTATADGPRVRVVHLAAGVPPIDVATDAGDEIVQGLAYPSATEYIAVSPGPLDVEIRPAGAADGWVVADPGGVFLVAANAYSMFVIGTLEDDALRLVTAIDATAPPPAPARLRVLHGAAGAPAVDLWVDAVRLDDDLAFGEVTRAVEVPAGQHRVRIVRAGTDPDDGALVDLTLPFAAGGAATLAATGSAEELVAQLVVDDPSPVADQAQLRIVHLVPDLPALAVGRDAAKKPLVAKLGYPNASRYLTVKPGVVDLRARLAGGSKAIVADLDPVTLDSGTSTSIFLVGTRGSDTLRPVIAQDAP